MAEPTIVLKVNHGTEGTPTWTAIDTAIRWVGAGAADGSLDVAFPAPIGDADEAWFDDAASPNDGTLWHETTGTDVQIDEAGRALNQNTLQFDETGGTDGTSDPPELAAYDDATDGQNRTDPTLWFLVGTSGSSNVSCARGVETTAAAPGAGWGTQVHDTAPSVGYPLDGDKTNEKVVCATALAANGSKEFQIAACAPHDSTSALSTFVYQCQYTYE
jgi:hypothetical protein